MKSRLVWARGLKLHFGDHVGEHSAVAPRVGAWVETTHTGPNDDLQHQSRLVWARGLKHLHRAKVGVVGLVAPRVGAWVET